MSDWKKWMERASNNGREDYKSLISSRLEIALLRVQFNPKYKKICNRLKKSEKTTDELLHKLPKEERLIIERYYDKQLTKESFELEEAYLQGMRDCILFLSHLDVFQREEYV